MGVIESFLIEFLSWRNKKVRPSICICRILDESTLRHQATSALLLTGERSCARNVWSGEKKYKRENVAMKALRSLSKTISLTKCPVSYIICKLFQLEFGIQITQVLKNIKIIILHNIWEVDLVILIFLLSSLSSALKSFW